MHAQAAEDFIVEKLRRGLSPTLYYHGLHHTLDVTAVALELAAAEGVTKAEDLALLRTAALYHDAGFLSCYQGHEAAGCQLVRATLPGFGYAPGQVEQICAMIMATRYPQEPHSLLDQILCDADLDYLGRPDFEPVSTSLFREMMDRRMLADERAWFQLQASFLTQHRFWTATAIARRATPKQARLDHIMGLLANWPAPDAPALGCSNSAS
jgi:predicted metal-dependent HD superfamily phosphohydrolase